jgi:hypothetical protein
VSAQPDEFPGGRTRPLEAVAGYLSAAAIFAGVVALFYYPGRLGPAAIVISLVGAGMAPTKRFSGLAVAVAALGWFFGTIIAVLLDRPMF